MDCSVTLSMARYGLLTPDGCGRISNRPRSGGGSVSLRLTRSLVAVTTLLALSSVATTPARQQDPTDALRRQTATVTDFQHSFIEVFGPAPAIANTPFLGLAVLTGAALISDSKFVSRANSPLLRRVRDNTMLQEVRTYASWWLFGALCVLALCSFLTNAGKLQGLIGKLVRAGESAGAGVAYLALGWAALESQQTAHVVITPQVMTAGLDASSIGSALALGIGLAIALVAMMIVRSAFDLLIWLNPIPFVDVIFETAKHAFSLGVMLLYFASPIAAATVAIMIVTVSVCLIPWAIRLLEFGYHVLLNPVLARLVPSLKPTLAEASVGKESPFGKTLFNAATVKARGLRKRQRVTCIQSADGIAIHGRFLFGRATTRRLLMEGEKLRVGRALGWVEIRVVGSDGRAIDRFAVSRALLPQVPTLCALLGAEDVGDIGAMQIVRELQRGATAGFDAATDRIRGHRSGRDAGV
jgi:hypothetical protein